MDLETLTLPLRFAFMQNAMLIAFILAPPTALLSCFLVMKGWALMGDAVAHAILPGVVLAYILGAPLILGAFAAGMTCAVVTGYLAKNSRVKQDTVMGVVFSGMFALGLVLYAAVRTDAHLDHILFGDMQGLGAEDLWSALAIAAPVALGLALKWRDLLLLSFDPAQARAAGLPVRWLHYGLLAALALTVVATLEATGLILAIGLLIAPGAIAYLIVPRFRAMLWIAGAACLIAMLGGAYASFWLDSAPAPTVILILTAMFVLALARRMALTRRATA